MANATKGGFLAKSGGILGPVVGAIIGVLLIVGAIVTDEMTSKKSQVNNAARMVGDRLRSNDEQEQPDSMPAPSQVGHALRPSMEYRQDLPRAVDSMLQLPMAWEVRIAAPEEDIFATYGSSGQGWTPDDFATARRENSERIQGEFADWDHNGDGSISRAEFESGRSGDPEDDFNRLDKNGDGFLTVPDEITPQQFRDMNWEQHDHHITKKVYIRFRSEGAAQIFAFGEPQNFRVVVAPERMEVRLSWDAPTADNLPPDLGYFIERHAPLTVDARRRQYAQDIAAHTRLQNEWDQRRDRWLDSTAILNDRGEPDPNGSPDEESRTFRQAVPRARWETAYVAWSAAQGQPDPQPVAPPPPTAWEVVAGPIQSTDYVDNTFELGMSYRYAVRAVTKSVLLRGTPSVDFGNDFKASEQIEAASPPVLIRNRIAMGVQGFQMNAGTIRLSQWMALRGETTTWYRITVIANVDTDANREVGGNYSLRDLTSRDATMHDVDGNEADAVALLPENIRIDFTTGFRFLGRPEAGFLLEHPDHGTFELTRATREAATETPTSDGLDNPMEVRLLAVASGARSGTFEVMRWKRVGGDWYRVVLNAQNVASGAAVGREVSLASPGAGVVVYDNAGREVPAATLSDAAFREATVDLRAGTFDGVDGRVAIVGGKRFDLFATLFAE